MKDPIVDEVRKARHDHAQRFNYDLERICEDLKKKEQECGHPVVSLPPKRLAETTSGRHRKKTLNEER